MCGIVALIVSSPSPRLRELVETMTDTLAHRGPDEAGSFVSASDGLALGIRRLSILDLEGGHQPMWDEEGDHCVVFNGEIYNFAELRRELLAHGHRFSSDHSDTEVLVHGFEQWGTALLPRLNGMFAFAIWDRRNGRLVVARDRAGEKPLYLAEIPGGYAVASELKALLRHPGLSRDLDPVALEQYLAFDYILGPRTIFKHVTKIPAGHYAAVSAHGYETVRYWAPPFSPTSSGEPALLEELEQLLESSVALRMVADVPVGLLLSGGLDSTTVGYFMRRQSDDVRSFSIGFEESRFDESAYARRAAQHLGTKHHLELFSQARVRELVPRVAEILDEPMGDQSIFPTYLLSTVARGEVKVALGGDGSDELLMGYAAYRRLGFATPLDAAPMHLRRAVAGIARRLPTRLGPLPLRGVRSARRLDERPVPRLLAYLGSFKGAARWVLAAGVRESLPDGALEEGEHTLLGDLPQGLSPQNQAIAAYLRGYLQEDILAKVDRASMAASLEVRAPFLDPRLIDFLLSVPPGLKLNGRTSKYLLKRLMRDRLPREVVERPKAGFAVPLDAWLRESLSPLVREYLDAPRVAAAGLFDPAAVAQIVREHRQGHGERGRQVWLLLQFELWRERWLG